MCKLTILFSFIGRYHHKENLMGAKKTYQVGVHQDKNCQRNWSLCWAYCSEDNRKVFRTRTCNKHDDFSCNPAKIHKMIAELQEKQTDRAIQGTFRGWAFKQTIGQYY